MPFTTPEPESRERPPVANKPTRRENFQNRDRRSTKCIVAIAVACSASYRRRILTCLPALQGSLDPEAANFFTANQGEIKCIRGTEAQQSRSIDSLPIADFVSGWGFGRSDGVAKRRATEACGAR